MPVVARSYEQLAKNPKLLQVLVDKANAKGLDPTKAILRASYDDNNNRLSDFEAEEAPYPIMSAVRHGIASLPSNAAGLVAGVTAGGAITPVAGPVAGFGAAMAAGTGAGMLVDKIERKALEQIWPSAVEKLDIDAQINPKMSTAGSLGGVGALQKNVARRAIGAVIKGAPKGGAEIGRLLAADAEIARMVPKGSTVAGALASHAAASAGAGAAQDIGMQLLSDPQHKVSNLDLGRVAEVAGLSALVGGGRLRSSTMESMADYYPNMVRNRVSANRPSGNPPQLLDPKEDINKAKFTLAELLEKDPTKAPQALREFRDIYGVEVDPDQLRAYVEAKKNQEAAKKLKEAEKAAKEAEKAEKTAPVDPARLTENVIDNDYINWLIENRRIDGTKKMTRAQAEELSLNPAAQEHRDAYDAEVARTAAEAKSKADAEALAARTKQEEKLRAEYEKFWADTMKRQDLDAAAKAKEAEKFWDDAVRRGAIDEGKAKLMAEKEAAKEAAKAAAPTAPSAPKAPSPTKPAVPTAPTSPTPETPAVPTKLVAIGGNKPVQTKRLAKYKQQTEITEEDLPFIEAVAKRSMGKLSDEEKNKLWQENQGAIVHALSMYHPSESRNYNIIAKATQSILRNVRLEEKNPNLSGIPIETAEEMNASGRAPRERSQDLADSSPADLVERGLNPAESTASETPEEPNTPAPGTPLKKSRTKGAPKIKPLKGMTGGEPVTPPAPKPLQVLDPSNPDHADFAKYLQEAGITPEEYARQSTGDDYQDIPENSGVVLKRSPIQGNGNFTVNPRKIGDIIGPVARPESDNPSKVSRTQLGRFTNHSANPNAEVVQAEGGFPLLRVRRPIGSDEEITVDYRQANKVLGDYLANPQTPAAVVAPAAPNPAGKPVAKPKPKVTKVAPEVLPDQNPANAEAQLRKDIGSIVDFHLADEPTPAQETAAKSAKASLEERFSRNQIEDILIEIHDVLDKGGTMDDAIAGGINAVRPANTPKPGTPIIQRKPLRGETGSLLGGVGDMARAVHNVGADVVNTAGDVLRRINKGFEEGGRPDFIRASTLDVLRPSVLKLVLDKDGKYNGKELAGRLANTMNPTEHRILQDAGLGKFLNERRTPEEVANWIEKNGPQVEVRKLYATGNRSRLELRFAEMVHELDTNYPDWRDYSFSRHGELLENDPLYRKLYTEWDSMATKVRIERNRNRNESATARYTMVNPKPLKDMPGAVDILVRVPKDPYKDTKYTSDHYPNEGKNLLAHVRGYMETLPDGRKVFHVFEVQSDWAQGRKKAEALTRTASGDDNYPMATADELVATDPLLKDYNRLALKAAIEHAYREGADAIAISDAETAMMTERHDQSNAPTIRATTNAQRDSQQLDANANGVRLIYDDEIEYGYPPYIATILNTDGSAKAAAWVKANMTFPKISQEPGMRFNYDPNPDTAGRSGKPGALHELAADITKYPGERVSFGNHQNAFNDSVIGGQNFDDLGSVPPNGLRQDLVFKNPDGAPKTDITAQLYPLDKIAARLETSPFSITGRGARGMELYGGLGGVSKLLGKTLDQFYRFLPEPVGKRLQRENPAEGGYAAEYVYPAYKRNEIKLMNNFLDPLVAAHDEKLTDAQWNKIGAYAYDMADVHVSPITLTAAERRAYNNVRESLDRIQGARIADGPYINGTRVPTYTQDFAPNSILSEKAKKILSSTDKANANDRNRMETQYAAWVKAADPNLTGEEINQMLGALLGQHPFAGRRNPTFSPLIKAEGIGLPPELREQNFLRVGKYYSTRSAQGLAWYRAVTKDPIAARIFGEGTNGRGESYVDPTAYTIDPSTPNPDQYLIHDYTPTPQHARNMSGQRDIEIYRAEMGGGGHGTPDAIDKATAFVNAFKLGPLSTMRDVVASSVGMHGEIANVSELPAFGRAMRKVFTGTSDAATAGGVRKHNAGEFAADTSLKSVLNTIINIRRKLNGRDLAERGVREMLWEFGREITKARLNSGDNKFLEQYGGKQWQRKWMEDPEAFLDHSAGRVMEMMQGNYGPEYLPEFGLRSSKGFLKGIFSLSRFSIERANRYRDTVIRPMVEDNNPMPFLKSTALYLGLAAPAAEKIAELLTDKKPKHTTWGEWLNLTKSGRPDVNAMSELAYDILGSASLTGMGGIISSALYSGLQVSHGERANAIDNPAWASAADLAQRIADYVAVYDGADLFKHILELPFETLKSEDQAVRSVVQRFNPDETGKREEQIYKRVTGKTVPSFVSRARVNPFSPLTDLKRTEDIPTMLRQVEPLSKMYTAQHTERASKFANELRDPDFYRFTTAMQTPQYELTDPRSAGRKQLVKDNQRTVLNSMRSAVAQEALMRSLLERSQVDR